MTIGFRAKVLLAITLITINKNGRRELYTLPSEYDVRLG